MDRVLVVGDVHGVWAGLNALTARKKPDLVLQCGDFGYWPRELGGGYSATKAYPFDPERWLKNRLPDGRLVPVYWCDGNHEDFPALHEHRRKAGQTMEPLEVAPACFWMPRGSTLKLPDGRVACFLGGAKSVDRALGEEGRDWFAEEVLQTEVLDLLPSRADVVVSHTAPLAFSMGRLDLLPVDQGSGVLDLSPDPSCDVLDSALERLRPRQWYFGHFHWEGHGETLGCRWQALSDLTRSGRGGRSWVWLD